MKQRFSDIIKKSIESYLENIHTCLPGKITEFDPITNRVSVQPVIKKKIGENTISYPIITDVPLQYPKSKDSAITFPIAKGDGCIILFSETSMENYYNSLNTEVEPGDSRKFSLTDAICIPGISPFTAPGLIGDGISLEIKFKDKKIVLNDTGITIDNRGLIKILINDTGITLSTGDAIIWSPNILPVDPMTGVPHGGVTAGIIKLRGA